MTLKYVCNRCGYSTNIKCNLITHFERKKQCKAILNDFDTNSLKLQVMDEKTHCKPYVNSIVNHMSTKNNNFMINNNTNLNTKGRYLCKYCNLEFNTRQSKSRHELKFCKQKKEINNKVALLLLEEKLAQKDKEMAKKDKEMEILIGYTKEQMDFMKKQIEILMKKAANNTTNNNDNSTNNTDNSITNNIDNKQINININGFGKEDLSYLTDRYFRELFNIPFSAITTLVEEIHFNPKKPQNWNAKIPDDKTSKALIYNAEKKMWVKREKKEVINDMVERSYNMLDTNFEIQKEAKTLDEKGKRKFENFMKIYDKGDKQLDKRYETEIREKLMNFREYHIK